MPILLVESGPDRGKSIHVSAGELFVVGRSTEANLALTDTLIAPAHFKLKGAKGAFYLRDCQSGKTTFVNDNTVDQVRLEFGDKIQVGETILSFLDDPAAGRSQDPLVGKTIDGKYTIAAHLGRGGMGTVYRAMQLGLEREVALKVLSPQLVKDREFVDLFQREAQAAAALNHPNITQVYDVGRADDLYYYSMEFFPGGSLEARLEREGRLPVDTAVRIVLDAARGLQYAEKKGLVHRDIKPDNLMVDGEGKTKIADLGLATRRQGGKKGGRVFGTPHFISPEQALGKEVDHRSDVYSLGATFYRLLTGHTPFQGGDIKEILRKQVNEPCPSLKDEHPDVPESVERIVHRMMQKDPERRYGTADELIADLEAARSGSTSGGGAKIAAGIIALLVLAGGAYALFGGGGDPENGKKPAVVQPKDPKEDDTPNRDRELEQQLRETRAKAAYLELGSEPSAAPFDAIFQQYPETEYGKLASERADEIRAAAAAAVEAEAAERAHLVELMQTLESDLRPLLQSHQYAQAHSTLEGFVGIEELAQSEDHGTKIDELRRQLRTEANLHFQDIQERARRLQVDNDFAATRQIMNELVDRYRIEGTPIDYLEDIVAEALTFNTELTKLENAWVAALYQDDQKVFTEIGRDASLLESVRKLRPADAASRLEAPLATLKTDLYRTRLTHMRDRLQADQRVLDSFKKAVRDNTLTRRELANDRIEGEIDSITGETLVVRRRNRPEDVPLADFDTAGRIADLLIDRWKIPANLQAAAAGLFADLGLAHLALNGDPASRRLFEQGLALAGQSGDAERVARIGAELAAADLYLRGNAAYTEQRYQLAIDLLDAIPTDHRQTDVYLFLSDGSQPIYGPGSSPTEEPVKDDDESGVSKDPDSNGGKSEEDNGDEGRENPPSAADDSKKPAGNGPTPSSDGKPDDNRSLQRSTNDNR